MVWYTCTLWSDYQNQVNPHFHHLTYGLIIFFFFLFGVVGRLKIYCLTWKYALFQTTNWTELNWTELMDKNKYLESTTFFGLSKNPFTNVNEVTAT